MSAYFFSPLSIILCCIIRSGVISLRDFCSCLFQVRSLIHFLPGEGKVRNEGKNTDVDAPTLDFCSNGSVASEKLGGEVEEVMERLGIFSDPARNKNQKGLSLDDIETLFDDEEPRLEEVREAFDTFDQNQDGFIDAEELERVLSALGLAQLSEVECQRMIAVFDENKDGRIELGEFLKLVEQSFC